MNFPLSDVFQLLADLNVIPNDPIILGLGPYDKYLEAARVHDDTYKLDKTEPEAIQKPDNFLF